jgi:uncharacterized protein (TIGR03067 family)
MHWLVMILVIGLLAPAGKGAEPDKDLKALEGTWQVESAKMDGQEFSGDDVADSRLVVQGDRYKQQEKDQVKEDGVIKLDPAQSPKAIDLRIMSGDDKGKTQLGIYKLDGDTLTVCLAKAGDKDRPKEFATKQGSGVLRIVFKRKK